MKVSELLNEGWFNEKSESKLDEDKKPNMKGVEAELAAHADKKIAHEKKFGPMSGADLHSHELKRKDLLKKLSRERSKANVAEAVAEPFKKFKKGQIVTVKKTGKKVEVLSQNDIGLVWTVSCDKDDLKIKNWRDYSAATLSKGLISGAGHQDYMPSELE